ncbi:T9SS type A sorting domain-containing protein [Spirosoma pulveris]
MYTSVCRSLALAFSSVLLASATALAQPVWTFRLIVAVEKQTAAYYEKTLSKPIGEIVREQIATVNKNFNSSSAFKGIYAFRADSIYVFSGSVGEVVFRSQPAYDYSIVINGFSDNQIGGGWYGEYRTIYHSWPWNYFDGPFAGTATDGLTHEFGHARGAIDIYGLRVEGKNNPVNLETFEPVNSIMNYPYGNITWDEHTTNLLNTTGGQPVEGEKYITDAFPDTMGIQVVDAQGRPLKNTVLTVYPVNWFSYSVTNTPILTAKTTDNGRFQFSSNPYQPDTKDYPWHIRYCNFLVKAVLNSDTVYTWIPLYDVQNAYFKKGSKAAYNAQVVFPVSPAAIKIGSLSVGTGFCAGSVLVVPFASNGSFEKDNVFTLQLSDAAGSFTNPTTLGRAIGDTVSAVSGTLPFAAGTRYRLRISSSNPVVFSGEVPVIIKSAPAAPEVQSLTVCQYSVPPALQATGFNLRWYTGSPNGAGTTVAPSVNTERAGKINYFVTQTGNGCEGPRATLEVDVRPLATATITGSQTILQGQPASLLVTLSGDGPWSFAYRDSTAAGPGTVQTIQTSVSSYTLSVKPVQSTAYHLTRVSNGCGDGVLAGSAVVVAVIPLLAIEEPLEALVIYPVPTAATLTVQIPGLSPKKSATLRLTTETGTLMMQREATNECLTINIGTYPAGTYVLHVYVGSRVVSKRILKL